MTKLQLGVTLVGMTIRAELDEFDTILTRVIHDLKFLSEDDRVRMPRWKFVRAGLRHTIGKLEGARVYLKETHSFVPAELDTDA